MATFRLFRVHVAHHGRSLSVMAVIVLLLSTLTALMPRAANHLLTDSLRHQVDDPRPCSETCPRASKGPRRRPRPPIPRATPCRAPPSLSGADSTTP